MPWQGLGRGQVKTQQLVTAPTSQFITFSTPANTLRRIIALKWHIHTSSASGLRISLLHLIDTTGAEFAVISSPRSVGPSSDLHITYAIGLVVVNNPDVPVVTAPIPDVLLLPGWYMYFDVLGWLSGDTINYIKVLYEEWTL